MKKKSFTPYIIAFVLFIGGLGGMVYSGLNEGSVYFLNVSEALAAQEKGQTEDNSMRLFGNVGSYTKNASGNSVEFVLIDPEMPEQTMTVVYSGIIPDTFDEGIEVILEGRLVQKASFQAETLMTKCPSKYEKENRT